MSTNVVSHVVSHNDWLAARKQHLEKEKDFTRLRDELGRERRALPWERVEKQYVFEGPSGFVGLQDLFGPHRQLLLYHFMFDPNWEEGCKSCSLLMDNVGPSVIHLAARNTAFAAVSRAPLAKIAAFQRRMGWNFPWVSSFGTDFNYDYHVTLDKKAGSVEYNFANAAALVKAGKLWAEEGELPGLSVFLREGNEIFHTYSTYQRGLDLYMNTYNFLDLTPLGRQEEGERIQSWVRHHDRYGIGSAAAPAVAKNSPAKNADCCHEAKGSD